jgi:hypothetical protein
MKAIWLTILALILGFAAQAQTVLFSRSAAFRGDITTGLLAHWKLDEASGNAVDSSGNGLTMTQSGTVPATSPGRGPFTSANFFSSSSASLQGLNAADWTMTVWFNTSSDDGNYQTLLGQAENTAGSAFWHLVNVDPNPTVNIVGSVVNASNPADSLYAGASTTATTGGWNFAAFVWVASTKTLYVSVNNGAFGSSSTSFTPGTGTITTCIGKRTWAGSEWPATVTTMQKIRIYTRALSTSDLGILYNGGTVGTAP